MAKLEFLQLAHKYDATRDTIAGSYVSEKLDGQRCFWDGGITRGLECKTIPWANTGKDARYIIPPQATGLWSRYGKTIQAPSWFLDQLPNYPLDGELWMGRGTMQETSSIIKQLTPDGRWHGVKFVVFDSPALSVFAQDRTIKTPLWEKRISGGIQFCLNRFYQEQFGWESKPFEIVYNYLKMHLEQTENLILHEQIELSFSTPKAQLQINSLLDSICSQGGEGLIARKRMQAWHPARCYHILKIKSHQDDEGIVIGYTWGRETDRGSKLLGIMGAMIVNYNGKVFELSGFTDAERELAVISPDGTPWAECVSKAKELGAQSPGQKCGPEITNHKFPIGSRVTFRFRELTNAGVPKEARYWRTHDAL